MKRGGGGGGALGHGGTCPPNFLSQISLRRQAKAGTPVVETNYIATVYICVKTTLEQVLLESGPRC